MILTGGTKMSKKMNEIDNKNIPNILKNVDIKKVDKQFYHDLYMGNQKIDILFIKLLQL